MKTYDIGVIAGDGIGGEVIPEGMRVLEESSARYGFHLKFEEYPWGSQHFLKHGSMMPEGALDELKDADAIYFGAVGDPQVADCVALGGLIIRIRQSFEQFANVRPAFLYGGVLRLSPEKNRKASTVLSFERTPKVSMHLWEDGLTVACGKKWPSRRRYSHARG